MNSNVDNVYCVWTRNNCHHPGNKCSECPVCDLVCEEFEDCLDSAYEAGRASVIEEIKFRESKIFKAEVNE